MTKNFINFHVLISHSPSCLNRDDMNMQKTAVFGGVNRVRISSQSLKHWMRKGDYYKANFEGSTRTRRLLDMLGADLMEQQTSDEAKKAAEQAALYAAAVFEGKTKPDEIKKYKRADNGCIETQVVPYHSGEIDRLRAILREAVKQKESERLGFVRDSIGKMQQEQAKSVSLDVALSGRMANSELIYNVDGALAVAHAITTHAVEPQDVDWFTAVDDLTQDAGETGAGHLNTQQFSSGVFYRYASLNLKQLQVNLGLLADMKSPETPDSRKRALDIARHAFHMLATVVPSAKQQSFAAHNLADFALVSFADQPISLANAFEQPVKKDYRNGGFLKPSIQSLGEYWARMNRAYGLSENARAFAVENVSIPGNQDGSELVKVDGKPALDSLAALENWIANDGQPG